MFQYLRNRVFNKQQSSILASAFDASRQDGSPGAQTGGGGVARAWINEACFRRFWPSHFYTCCRQWGGGGGLIAPGRTKLQIDPIRLPRSFPSLIKFVYFNVGCSFAYRWLTPAQRLRIFPPGIGSKYLVAKILHHHATSIESTTFKLDMCITGCSIYVGITNHKRYTIG